MPVNTKQRRAAAARLLQSRRELSGQLARLVKDWPKYSAQFAQDPSTFAEFETAALVDYMAAYLERDDAEFRDLYIGEKAKQFHDPSMPAAEREHREAVLLAAERELFVNELREFPDASLAAGAAFDEIAEALTGDAPKQLRVLLIGDCLYLDVIAFLTGPALADGIKLVPTFVTSHDVVEIEAGLAKLADQKFDVVFVSTFTYAFLPSYEALQRWRLSLRRSDARRESKAAVRAAETIFDTVAELFDCPIVAHLPVPLLRHSGSMRERFVETITSSVRRRAVNALRRSLEQRARERSANGQSIMLLDEKNVVAPCGLREAGRYYHQLALQHPARFGALVAEHYRDILFAVAHLFKRKLVACDLDNTLWDGVIGEGLGVTHFFDRHRALLKLKQRGVVLAINSKNDPAKVVWDAKEDGLTLDHFVSQQINWDPKPLNMRRIAEHLNLKEKDFVFIDDRADERALVQEQFPALMTLDATNQRSWRLLGVWAELLPDNPNADRTEFYKQRDARVAFMAEEPEADAAARDAMYAELGLSFSVREAEATDLIRVAELINRTNQFNMAGSRVTRSQVEVWSSDPATRILIGDASDRFGAMGTVSVLVLQCREERSAHMPVFVLSCRVFGYGMDMAMLEAARSLVEDAAVLTGAFAETDFNQPCHGVYPAAGFRRVDGGWRLDRPCETPITVPRWLGVTLAARPLAIAEN